MPEGVAVVPGGVLGLSPRRLGNALQASNPNPETMIKAKDRSLTRKTVSFSMLGAYVHGHVRLMTAASG